MEFLIANIELIIASAAMVVGIFTCIILFNKQASTKSKLQELSQLAKSEEHLKNIQKQHSELLNELKMVTQGLSQKLTSIEIREPEDVVKRSDLVVIEQQLQSLENKLQSLENQDPTSRLYTKASKLVASGASIEEIMQECDLPRAEAELVMSLHARK